MVNLFNQYLKSAIKYIYKRYILKKFYAISKIWDIDQACLLLNCIPQSLLIDILTKYGATIGHNCVIETPITLHCVHTNFSNLIIGDNTCISKNCLFDLSNKITIGENCTIAMGTRFITHLDLGNSSLKKYYKYSNSPIKVENDVYVGAYTTILKGITINQRVLIGSNSLINKDLEQDSVYFGSPAKLIKKI